MNAAGTEHPRRLRDVDYVFDVILSDFGRDATLRLLAEVANIERSLIVRILGREHGRQIEFLDEYRRVMYDCIGDLGYIKREVIRHRSSTGTLPRAVLFGVEGTRISARNTEAIADVLTPAIDAALERGYSTVRVVIPCNTLASIEYALIAILQQRLAEAEVRLVNDDAGATRQPAPQGARPSSCVWVYSVPRVVLDHVVTGVRSAKLMLLGTELAREIYSSVLRDSPGATIEVIECSQDEQALMDELLVASIGGDQGAVTAATAALERRVFAPRKRLYGDSFVVVQASTDYDVGIGANSLRILAHQLVLDVYGDALWTASELSKTVLSETE